MRICQFVKLPQSLPAANPAPSKKEPALSVAARHLSQRERQVWIVRKLKAFLPEEGGTAQAVTEGAARKQVCMRSTLIRQANSSHRLLGSPLGRAGICEAND